MSVITATSPNLLIAEWSSRFKGTIPLVQDLEGPMPLTVADKYAELVTDRWVYVIAETEDWENAWEVIHELYIDDKARTWVTTKATPYQPIPDRGSPIISSRKAAQGFAFRRVDPKGRALWVRLLISRHQLPSAAIVQLSDKRFRELLHEHVAPLWDWEQGGGDHSVLVSRDGWSLRDTPLWLRTPDDGPYPERPGLQRVAVGIDPFTLALNRSTVFVQAHRAYQRVYEPDNPAENSEFHKNMLLKLIDDTILSNQGSIEKYRGALDIARINRAVEAEKKRRLGLVRVYENAGAALCKVMDSPFFWLYQQASLSDEGIDPSDKSDRLVEHLRVLAHCTRLLNACTSGRGLLRMWAEDSQKHPDHFVNHVILPTVAPPVYYVKSFRWASKAIASVLSEYISHRVAVARRWTQLEVAETVLKPLCKLADISRQGDWEWFKNGKFDPTVQITDIGVAGEIIDKETVVLRNNFDLGEIKVDVKTARFDRPSFESIILRKDHIRFLEDWIEAGEIKDFGRNAALIEAKLINAVIFDAINIALALGSFRDNLGGPQALRAFGDVTAHSLNLAVAIADPYIEKLKLSTEKTLKLKVAFAAVRAVTGAYMAVTALSDAVTAFRSGDNDKGYALAVAAAAEATAATGYAWMAFTVGSVVAPWMIAIATLVAACAYIIAMFGTDDHLETFLKHCEWGIRPYDADDHEPSWSRTPIGRWSQDYLLQQKLLIKLLARISVSWVRFGMTALGVEIGLAMFTPSTQVRVRYEATLADGTPLQEDFAFSGDQLPDEMPGRLVVRPSRTVNDATHPRNLTAIVSFRLLPDTDEERIVFSLVRDGIDQTDKAITNLD